MRVFPGLVVRGRLVRVFPGSAILDRVVRVASCRVARARRELPARGPTEALVKARTSRWRATLDGVRPGWMRRGMARPGPVASETGDRARRIRRHPGRDRRHPPGVPPPWTARAPRRIWAS
ncbi:hypothetical protein Aca07nite_78860 [Actinoplanes capillaceus]|uniref:Uncharacterized protein n=1 Tax=Actinoplanes campanulatus TaxID=113559 RepID=A0ABQ3WWF1_9ACTN|nr:hypothetical protein Aca07nite_78860 [Actinoplanes capillaceus]